MIQVKNLKKNFGDLEVLKNINVVLSDNINTVFRNSLV